MAARRTPNLFATCIAAAVAIAVFRGGCTFLPPFQAATQQPKPNIGIANVAGATGAVVAMGAVAPPAFAEDEMLNFGKIELGGGFAINLDIPETGLVNIVVIIFGLFYLLGPLLSGAMEARNKEIQRDIEDAIKKFNEANERLAEAQKAKAQANQVIAEIDASIKKDQEEYKQLITSQTKDTIEKQALSHAGTLAAMKDGATDKVNAFIQSQAMERGMAEIKQLSTAQKAKFMEAAIDSL